jgi:AP-1 complex subunit gamma-1
MLCLAGNFISDEISSSIINLIISTEELHIYSVHKLYIAMKSNMSQEALMKVGIYILGELGYDLISNSVEGPEGESIVITEEELVNHLMEINSRKYSNDIKEYLMNCLMKLITKLTMQNSKEKMKNCLEEESKSYNCEVQQRAVEYIFFTNLNNFNLKKNIMSNVPNSKLVKETETKKYLLILMSFFE